MAKKNYGGGLPLIGFVIMVSGAALAAYGSTVELRFIGVIFMAIGAFIAGKGS